MGLDQDFYMVKKGKHEKVLTYYDLQDISAKHILWLRKEYEISEIIGNIKGDTGYGDYIKISHKELKQIIKEYEKIIWKEEKNKGWYIMVIHQLELIEKLFNFRKYDLYYGE